MLIVLTVSGMPRDDESVDCGDLAVGLHAKNVNKTGRMSRPWNVPSSTMSMAVLRKER